MSIWSHVDAAPVVVVTFNIQAWFVSVDMVNVWDVVAISERSIRKWRITCWYHCPKAAVGSIRKLQEPTPSVLSDGVFANRDGGGLVGSTVPTLVWSQRGPMASIFFHTPLVSAASRFDSECSRVLLRRFWCQLLLSSAICQCGQPLDSRDHHWDFAPPRFGSSSLESVAALICREAGGRVYVNIRVQDPDLCPGPRADNRHLEVVADGLLSAPPGRQLQGSACETGGRWSEESTHSSFEPGSNGAREMRAAARRVWFWQWCSVSVQHAAQAFALSRRLGFWRSGKPHMAQLCWVEEIWKAEEKLPTYFCGDDWFVAVDFRTTIPVNQFSICGAVADMCDELACRISGFSTCTGKRCSGQSRNHNTILTELMSTNKSPRTDANVQGNLFSFRMSVKFTGH